MPNIVKDDAEEIAKKLNRESPKKPNRQKFTAEGKQGREHFLVYVRYGDVFIGRYGIERGSRKANHNHVANQIHLTRTQGYDFAKCTFSVDDFIEALVESGEIEDPDKKTENTGEPQSG